MIRLSESKLPAAALPTAMVMAMLMTLTVLFLLALWESESLLHFRSVHRKKQRLSVESGFTLYEAHPEQVLEPSENMTHIDLYEVGAGTLSIKRSRWGLYELVNISTQDGKYAQTRLLGEKYDPAEPNFYYADAGNALTLTGKSVIQGMAHLPARGVIYGQMRSIFFSGEELSSANIRPSASEMPGKSSIASQTIKDLLALMAEELTTLQTDSVSNSFRDETLFRRLSDGRLSNLVVRGNIILVGDYISIGPECGIDDVVVVGERIRLKTGFSGTGQFFARDSLILEEGVVLAYPSGLYSNSYIEVKDNCVVNGYAIVESSENPPEGRALNYRQSRLSRIRGLVYVDGNATVQGIISGQCLLTHATYYAPEGYYKNMIYDATILQNRWMGYPLWLEGGGRERETIKQLE